MSTHASAPHLQHHFDTPAQQYDSAKLGMWLFLATEVLLFGGLFCAYAVYRANHPEVFTWAHHLLDTNLGAINTVVLLTSSLTMAWAVRCAQLGKRTGLIVLLALTLAGAFAFLGIKYVEYEAKWKHGLLWGRNWQPDEHYLAEHFGAAPDAHPGPPAAATPQPGPQVPGTFPERSTMPRAPSGPSGRAGVAADAAHGVAVAPPNLVHVFFGIYFLMTGLHGLHVLAGMGVIAWLLVGAIRGRYGPDYNTPVDLGGLYWHLVDLIWIFLFPLLYLIH